MFLSMRDVIKWTLLNFPVSCWIDISDRTCCTVVGYFLLMTRIKTLVLFISWKEWFHGLLFLEWEIYDILLCSQYFASIPIGVYPFGKLTLDSNIQPFMKGWSERSIFNSRRVEIFVRRIISERGDHPLPNLFLCSSDFADEQYLSFLVCGSYHLIVALLFV